MHFEVVNRSPLPPYPVMWEYVLALLVLPMYFEYGMLTEH